MPDMQTAREALSHLLVDIQEVDESVVRGEKRLGQQAYAVAYVDFADDVVGRSEHLREFQERVLGDEFFETQSDLRWNKYLYFVAGPKSIASPHFDEARAVIEADKDYARKRVVSEKDLESLLGGAKLFEPVATDRTYDVLDEWERRLTSKNLDLLLDCGTPRTGVVQRIAQGKAARTTDFKAAAKSLNAADKQLSSSKLRHLTVTRFRKVHDGKPYEFGDVTLIIGANGTGKTSLLEAIEYFYCGKNRRANSTGAIHLKATLQQSDDGAMYELSSTADGPRIKARCLSWYNRNEHKVDAIVDSFSQYNFLDTDAAYRLSGTLGPGDVANELSRLLVGPVAATTYEYFGKIRADIEKAYWAVQRNIENPKDELGAAENRLKELQDQPSNGKTLLESYRASLAGLGWRGVSQASTPGTTEGELLLKALADVQALATSGEAARTIADIHRREQELRAVEQAAFPWGQQLSTLTRQENELIERISVHDANVQHLDRWMVYEDSGFNAIRRGYPAALQAHRELSGRLGNFIAGDLPKIPSSLSQLSLEVATATAQNSVQIAEARESQAAEHLRLHEEAASSRSAIVANLKVAAMAALKASASPDTCPVCGAVHSAGTLLHLIDELTASSQGSAELAKLVESRRLALEEAVHAKNAAASLAFIESVANSFSLGVELTPSQVLEELAGLRQQTNSAKATLQKVTDDGKSLGQQGFSSQESDLIWAKIGSLFEDSTSAPTLEAIAKVWRLQSLAVESKRTELETCRLTIAGVTAAIQDLCKKVDLEAWGTRVRLINSTSALTAMREEFAVIAARVNQLRTQMDVGDDIPLVEVQANLSSVLSAFKEAQAGIASESASSADLQELPKRIESLKLKLNMGENEAKALQSAMTTLDDIFANASLETATAEALAAIGKQINEVFTRIHSPHEYEYVDNHEALLQTIGTHEQRTLNEVSTGQRAAFALSIFLARNRTAMAAPPVLLIDDPIAHIDDLNALSFLDYLRDLAVNSGRQIFFATADTRIASLFSKKFSFLGERFKTIPLTRMPEVEV